MKVTSKIALLAAALVLGGCVYGPDYGYVRGDGYYGDAYYGASYPYYDYYGPGCCYYGYPWFSTGIYFNNFRGHGRDFHGGGFHGGGRGGGGHGGGSHHH